jgi:hypothetical protein
MSVAGCAETRSAPDRIADVSSGRSAEASADSDRGLPG